MRNLLELAGDATGLSVDFWAGLTEGLDRNAVALLVMRAEMMSAEMHRGVPRDARLGRFVRQISSGSALPGILTCGFEAAELSNSDADLPKGISTEKKLAVGDVLKAFDVIYPEETGDVSDVLGLWVGLDEGDKRMVSDMVKRLSS
ncbi:hypothetical protein [Pseudophaeobacter leonis]|uniref:hypothetical protein n=1 Tax=Pseudophaeobacter leonis TaxID=1144477 RepID=UPI0009F40C53|nr:hypothetical protein [Pseudophaeobacter leonis]